MRLYLEALLAEALQTAANRLLRLDPESPRLLAPLAGKRIRIEFQPFGLSLVLALGEREVVVLTGEVPADVTLRGTPLAFFRLLLARNPRRELFQGVVAVEGDLHLAQRLQQLLGHFRADLDGLLGEEPAHLLRALLAWQGESWRAFQEDLAASLQEERRILPHRRAFEAFAREVARLRDDTERLSSRLDLLREELSKASR